MSVAVFILSRSFSRYQPRESSSVGRAGRLSWLISNLLFRESYVCAVSAADSTREDARAAVTRGSKGIAGSGSARRIGEVLDFLQTHAPKRDDSLSAEYKTTNAALALRAHDAVVKKWGRQFYDLVPRRSSKTKVANILTAARTFSTATMVAAGRASTTARRDDPDHALPFLFLNDVAPYAVFTEPRTPWRAWFYERLEPFLQRAETPRELISQLDQAVWSLLSPTQKPAEFLPAGPDAINNYSVADFLNGTYTNGVVGSSCTGMAIFFVACLRTVGIPARAAGVPHWNKDRKVCPEGDQSPACGNHNWVEVWDGTSWRFLSPGPEESRPLPLDNGWFFPSPVSAEIPLHGNHSVYATSWVNTTAPLLLPGATRREQAHAQTDQEQDKDRDVVATVAGSYLANEAQRKSGLSAAHSGHDLPVPHFPMVWASQEDGPLDRKVEVSGWDATCRYLQLSNATNIPSVCGAPRADARTAPTLITT